MGRIIITHVGTSLVGCPALTYCNSLTPTQIKENIEEPLIRGEEIQGKWRANFTSTLEKGLNHVWSEAFANGRAADDDSIHQDRRAASPGEIASLSLLKPVAGDRIILLHSDTKQGRFCSEVLLEVLKNHDGLVAEFPSCQPCELLSIQVCGLKVVEGGSGAAATEDQYDTFVGKGLTNYVGIAWGQFGELRNKGVAPKELIFNVTGGYKGTIPFARDLVLILADEVRKSIKWLDIQLNEQGITDQRRSELNEELAEQRIVCKLCYLFEQSDRLIWYGAFPIGIDWDELPDTLLHDGLQGVSALSVTNFPDYFMAHHTTPDVMVTNGLGALLLSIHDNIFVNS